MAHITNEPRLQKLKLHQVSKPLHVREKMEQIRKKIQIKTQDLEKKMGENGLGRTPPPPLYPATRGNTSANVGLNKQP